MLNTELLCFPSPCLTTHRPIRVIPRILSLAASVPIATHLCSRSYSRPVTLHLHLYIVAKLIYLISEQLREQRHIHRQQKVTLFSQAPPDLEGPSQVEKGVSVSPAFLVPDLSCKTVGDWYCLGGTVLSHQYWLSLWEKWGEQTTPNKHTTLGHH